MYFISHKIPPTPIFKSPCNKAITIIVQCHFHIRTNIISNARTLSGSGRKYCYLAGKELKKVGPRTQEKGKNVPHYKTKIHDAKPQISGPSN